MSEPASVVGTVRPTKIALLQSAGRATHKRAVSGALENRWMADMPSLDAPRDDAPERGTGRVVGAETKLLRGSNETVTIMDE